MLCYSEKPQSPLHRNPTERHWATTVRPGAAILIYGRMRFHSSGCDRTMITPGTNHAEARRLGKIGRFVATRLVASIAVGVIVSVALGDVGTLFRSIPRRGFVSAPSESPDAAGPGWPHRRGRNYDAISSETNFGRFLTCRRAAPALVSVLRSRILGSHGRGRPPVQPDPLPTALRNWGDPRLFKAKSVGPPRRSTGGGFTFAARRTWPASTLAFRRISAQKNSFGA